MGNSVNDWGYKFTVVAHYASHGDIERNHWLVDLEKQLTHCKSSLASAYIKSVPWNKALEDRNTVWMGDSLLSPELFTGTFGDSAADQLLVELTDRPPKSPAENFVKILKEKVPTDQGTDDVINRAVYSTCAALIKHNNLSSEALAVANGVRTEVSAQLVRAWTSGQKMRYCA